MTLLLFMLFIGVLWCLAVLDCCKFFVSGRLNIKQESAGCVKGLILKNMAGREKDAGRLYKSTYKE